MKNATKVKLFKKQGKGWDGCEEGFDEFKLNCWFEFDTLWKITL